MKKTPPRTKQFRADLQPDRYNYAVDFMRKHNLSVEDFIIYALRDFCNTKVLPYDFTRASEKPTPESLESEISFLEEHIASRKEEIDALKRQIWMLENEILSIKEKIENHEGDIILSYDRIDNASIEIDTIRNTKHSKKTITTPEKKRKKTTKQQKEDYKNAKKLFDLLPSLSIREKGFRELKARIQHPDYDRKSSSRTGNIFFGTLFDADLINRINSSLKYYKTSQRRIINDYIDDRLSYSIDWDNKKHIEALLSDVNFSNFTEKLSKHEKYELSRLLHLYNNKIKAGKSETKLTVIGKYIEIGEILSFEKYLMIKDKIKEQYKKYRKPL